MDYNELKEIGFSDCGIFNPDNILRYLIKEKGFKNKDIVDICLCVINDFGSVNQHLCNLIHDLRDFKNKHIIRPIEESKRGLYSLFFTRLHNYILTGDDYFKFDLCNEAYAEVFQDVGREIFNLSLKNDINPFDTYPLIMNQERRVFIFIDNFIKEVIKYLNNYEK